jgi:hypothetical protein
MLEITFFLLLARVLLIDGMDKFLSAVKQKAL